MTPYTVNAYQFCLHPKVTIFQLVSPYVGLSAKSDYMLRSLETIFTDWKYWTIYKWNCCLKYQDTFKGESVTIYSKTGNPREALAASATCKWRRRSSSSIPASRTNPTCFKYKILYYIHTKCKDMAWRRMHLAGYNIWLTIVAADWEYIRGIPCFGEQAVGPMILLQSGLKHNLLHRVH